jgi:Bacteriophage HK97-gp10, putative tail-component
MPSALAGNRAFAVLAAQMAEIEKEAAKELTKLLREIGNEARDVVRSSTEPPYATGKLRKSVKTSVRQKGVVSLYSNLPQAPVFEFGGSIKPRGTPITIPQTNFVRGPVVALGDDIDERMAEAFDDISHRHGFL